MKRASVIQVLVAVFCVFVTLFAYHNARSTNLQRAETVFAALTNDSQAALLDRLHGYELSLDSAAAFLSGSDRVTARDWQRYVATLDIADNLPGLRGLSLIEPVARGEEAAFLARTARDGMEGITIHPDTGQGDRLVVKFAEPRTANAALIGFDIASDPARLETALRARDRAMPQVTPAVTLVQGGQRIRTFLVLRAIYDPSLPADTVDERRAALVGWIGAPFIAGQLLDEIARYGGGAFHLEVYDSADPLAAPKVYENAAESSVVHAPRHVITRQIPVMGRVWTMSWHSTPAFEATQANNAALLVLFSGLGLTALIALLFRSAASRARTVQRLVEQKSRELEATVEQNKSIIDTALVAILLLDADLVVLSANRALRTVLDLEESEIRGSRLSDLVPGFTPARVVQGGVLHARSGRGREVVLDVSANSWRNASGQLRYSVLIRDISEQHRAQRALAQSEERWMLALEGARIGVFDIDLTTGKSVVSHTWKQLIGISDEAGDIDTQAEFMARVHPEDKAQLLANDAACIEGETDRSITEFRLRTAPGSWRWMRSEAGVVERDEAGRALRFVGAQTDITDLREARDALRLSREQFALLLESAPAAMALLNDHSQFHGCNDALCRISGYSREELLGMRFRDIVQREELSEIYRRMNELRTSKVNTYQHEHRFIRKDGTTLWGLLSVAWTRDLSSDKEIFIAQVQDITAMKEAERVKSEFVATVSHELRTPLTSIKGAIGLMNGTMANRLDEGTGKLLKIADDNCNRLISLVNDILDLEKIASGDIAFDMADHALDAQIGQAVDQMLPYCRDHGVTLRCHEDGAGLRVRADAGRMVQVLVNLLSNAAKFSSPGQEITLRARRDGGHARIEVTDHGPGISDEFRKRIFQPFSQADSSATRRQQGTGLGLNISRQIVERMGGRIGFTSRPDVETTFWFTLPLSGEGRRLAAVSSETGPAAGGPSGYRVLHCERDQGFAHIVALALRDCGRLVRANCGRGAHRRINEEAFDLVILGCEVGPAEAQELLDLIELRSPGAAVITLTEKEHPLRDPRIAARIVKSRQSVEDIGSTVRRVLAKRVPSPAA